MEMERVNFGRSILVPSVKELGKEGMVKIPARYTHPDQETPAVWAGAHQSVPVIDMQSLLFGDSRDSELERLHSACKEWGFFQVANHGVSNSLFDILKSEIQEFFELPLEEKKKLWQQPDDQEGFGQLFVVSEEQKLDWSDIETMEAYSLELKRLAITILAQMAKALKMETEEMKELFNDGVQAMRMNYYPPCPEPDMAIGFTPHSDADALTIVLQLNQTEGLQIRKDGNWVPVKPLPYTFVANVGDMMEIVSNGVYRSIEHRATVNLTKDRLSIATFYSTNLDAELGPAHSLIGPDNPANFRRVPVEKYFKDFFARKLNGKSHLDFMRIETQEGNTIGV
ncbi:hypothetical protein HHK36_005052 [Tetracentron sinense]|uniref:Fe2OG dioxygenase domain-containing protein n=1 Tax=Tetracentron sinense TaxID=13715 RepID=A0A834ZTE0_TETSI|nr:hypothetical protein HHK36_005052 [Tetracentron sinense]